MACRYPIRFILLASIFVLMLEIRLGNLAPTHHLKISVQGNTPRLIVTSAEIDVASNIETAISSRANAPGAAILENANANATATPPTTLPPQPTKWLLKANQQKLKSKSFTTPNDKKRDKSTKEKAMGWQGKQATATSAPPFMPPVATTMGKYAKTEGKSKKVMKYFNPITTSKPRIVLGSPKVSKYDEFNDETKHTASLTTAPTAAAAGTSASDSSEKKLETVESTVLTPKGTVLSGKLPQTSASMAGSRNADIALAVTSVMTPKASSSTEALTTAAAIVLTTPIPPSIHDAIDVVFDGKTKALPEAVSEKTRLTMETTSTFSVETTTTVITTEVNDADSIVSSTIKPVPQAKTASDATQGTTLLGGDGLLIATPSPTLALDTSAPHTTRASEPQFLKPNDSEEDATQQTVVKLIDLENHEAAVDELRTKKQSLLDSGGHDGVKQTKKKQLLDKHFTADVTTEFNLETIIETSTLLSTSTFKPDTSNKAESVNVVQQQEPNIEKPVLTASTLAPVHNGYLGPIRMAERTFSMKHDSEEKPKVLKHEASIESKLHEGRIVEIIAPTALVEQETQTSAALKYDVTSTAEPNANRKHPETAVLSTTVFQVQEPAMSTTRQPINVGANNSAVDQQRESRISDIQIEVFDSVVAPQRNLPADEYSANGAELGRTRPPALLPTTLERFTQYVVDRIESSTPDTIANGNLNFHGIGKPEPAAIEIHINVSEDMTNQNENFDFSYRQGETNYDFESANDITIKPPNSQNNSYSDHNDEILVVEIIDNGDNSTETQATNSDNINPTITFRASDAEPNDDDSPQAADELFMANSNKNGNVKGAKPPLLPPPPPPHEPTIERDSDTIFYISNTEVKVGESPPNLISGDANQGNRLEVTRRTRLESQFFPANYMASTYPSMASGQQMQQKHLYEEDIILSPVRNTADSLKIFRSQNDGAPPLDITYVGESMIEVEQSSDGAAVTTTVSASAASEPAATQTPDVIIQPAMLPEMSIGVPVIGELPPQIELKEIDFMPNEANQQRSGVHKTENNDIEENLSESNNDIDRLVESSIQYGGDLIDEGADNGGGFDGVEGSFPFGNMAAMRRRAKSNDAADYAHFTMHYGVNNLRKDEMSVDVANANAREAAFVDGGTNENGTRTLQNGSEALASMNITYAIADRIEGNATAFSIDPQQADEILGGRSALSHGPIELLIICGLLLLLAPLILLIPYFSFRLFKRLYGGRHDSESSDVILPNGNVARCDPAELTSKGDEPCTRPPTPKKEDSSEHDSTKNRNCLPVLDDSNSTKPSNNSNSLNILNEKHITDSTIKKRSTDTSRRTVQQANGQSDNSVPDSYAGPNGSVTTMTLKNNHLIVETEERNDISRDARETKMHYTSDKDGVFVVEVARGADSKIIPESPIAELVDDHLFVKQPKLNGNNNRSPTRRYEDEPAVLNSHEHVQIHPPPTELSTSNTERSLHQIEEVEEESFVSPKVETVVEMNFEPKANTGLSQSDLSSTSSADSNKRYNYGNQVLYTNDQTDYTSSSPVNVNATPKRLPTAEPQDDDHTSESGQNSNTTPEKFNSNEEHYEQQFIPDKENPEVTEKNETLNNENKEEGEHEMRAGEKVEMEVKAETEVAIVEEQILVEDTVSREDLDGDVETKNSENGAENIEILATKEEAKEEIMSVSDVDCAIESVTSETGTTQKLVQSKANALNNPQQDNQTDLESLAQAETDPEFTYDSLMSLPDPPSNEEMTQFGDFNGIETTQLDSLPPPPPPPATLASESALLVDENTNMPDVVAEIKSKSCHTHSINGNVEYFSGHGNLNGREASEQIKAQAHPMPPPIQVEEINSNGKIMPSSPLTPPESPPPSPPVLYSNGVIGMNEQMCAASVHAVAVDVNGS